MGGAGWLLIITHSLSLHADNYIYPGVGRLCSRYYTFMLKLIAYYSIYHSHIIPPQHNILDPIINVIHK